MAARARPGETARAKEQVRRYLAAQPPRQRKALKAIRDAIRSASPGSPEYFSYRMPAFRLENRMTIWYAGYQEHVSLYPFGDTFVRRHAPALLPRVASRGTIRFTLDEAIPVTQIKRLIKAQAARLKR